MYYSFLLIGIFVFVFFLELIQENFFIINFSLIPSLAFLEPYRLFTSLFLHADFFHLFFNSWALFLFGPILEKTIGKKHFLIVFFVSGLIGNLLYIFLQTKDIPAIGASGAIFGVIGTLAILRPSIIVFFYFLPIPITLFALIFAIYEGILSFTHLYEYTTIASPAHFGGLIFGLIYGYFFKKLRKPFGKRDLF